MFWTRCMWVSCLYVECLLYAKCILPVSIQCWTATLISLYNFKGPHSYRVRSFSISRVCLRLTQIPTFYWSNASKWLKTNHLVLVNCTNIINNKSATTIHHTENVSSGAGLVYICSTQLPIYSLLMGTVSYQLWPIHTR